MAEEKDPAMEQFAELRKYVEFSHKELSKRLDSTATRADVTRLERKTEARFDQVDKQFEQVDKRFEQVDKRFEQVDKRFEQVDRRFDLVDARFDRVETRFDRLDRKLDALGPARRAPRRRRKP